MQNQISSLTTTKIENTLCQLPNATIRPAKLDLLPGLAKFEGYQNYTLSKNSITVSAEDERTARKKWSLESYFNIERLHGKTMLDLGANSGLFCFWALQNGCKQASAVDMDEEYIELTRKAAEHLGYNNLESARSNISDWHQPADLVLALAIIHWIYSCTSTYGSLDSIIKKLSELTNELLVIEWVEPCDEWIKSFNHLNWNEHTHSASYDIGEFKAALSKYFVSFFKIAEITSTRSIYVAFKGNYEHWDVCPLPSIYDNTQIISCKLLTILEDHPYWSRVYDLGESICKQTTWRLAEREMAMLKKLSGQFFPRAFDLSINDNYSVLTLEKIIGEPLNQIQDRVYENRLKFFTFILDCISILEQLERAQIVHFDIKQQNIIMRDDSPVLIDFGWATTKNLALAIPKELLPLDEYPCNIYAMGKLFSNMNKKRFPEIDVLCELMTVSREARLTDISALRELVKSMKSIALSHDLIEESSPHPLEFATNTLVNLYSQLLGQVRQLKDEVKSLENENNRVNFKLSEIAGSHTWRIASGLRHYYVQAVKPFLYRAPYKKPQKLSK